MDKDKIPHTPGSSEAPRGPVVEGEGSSAADSPLPDSAVPGSPPPGSTSSGPASKATPPSGALHPSGAGKGKPSAAAPAGKKARRRGKGKWIALLVIAALLAAGYYLWPLYGDRIGMLSGALTENTSPPPRQPDGNPPPGADDGVVAGQVTGHEATGDQTTGDQTTDDETVDVAADDTQFAGAPPLDDVIEGERSAREAMATELRDQMADIQLQLNSHADRLRQLSTTSRDDWLLAEAEYLLRLASQRILTERQTANATALMASADVILRDMSDPALYPVRKALAEDITRIRMADPVDREGIFLRIGALVDSVDSLDSLLPEPGATMPEDGAAAEPASWHGRLLANARRAAAGMIGLVRVERRDVPLQPMLTLEQEQTLRYNLKVVLEQARLALLREEQVIYADSLGRASDWVGEHFQDNARAATFIAEVDTLADLTVSQELPSVNPSLRALQDYIRLWHNRFEPAEATGNGTESSAAPPGSAAQQEDESP